MRVFVPLLSKSFTTCPTYLAARSLSAKLGDRPFPSSGPVRSRMSEPAATEDQYAATLELLSSLITQDRRGAGQWETVHEYMGSWVQVDCSATSSRKAVGVRRCHLKTV